MRRKTALGKKRFKKRAGFFIIETKQQRNRALKRIMEEMKMKVLLINGSPHEKGCTYTALREMADTLEQQGVETEIFWIGDRPLRV